MRLLLILIIFTLQTKSQTLCDSLSFSVSTSSALTVVGINSSSDSTNFMWGVCDNSMCYSASGDTAYFFLVNPLDTVKVCYDISPQWSCTECNYVIFNGFTWQLLNTTTHVNEIKPHVQDNKIYDLLGRELKSIPKRGMYIKNSLKYFISPVTM